jgi:hypothetical protein
MCSSRYTHAHVHTHTHIHISAVFTVYRYTILRRGAALLFPPECFTLRLDDDDGEKTRQARTRPVSRVKFVRFRHFIATCMIHLRAYYMI